MTKNVATKSFVEPLYCEHTNDWNLKVWGPQGGDRVKPGANGGTFNFSLVVTGVTLDAGATA